MKKYLYIALVALGLAALGYAFGRYTAPEKVVEKEKIKVQTVEVVKEVIKEVKVENKNVNTRTRVVEYPDGRKETITEVIDRTTVGTNTDTNTDSNSSSTTEKEKEKITINKKPDWKFTGLAGVEISDFGTPIYGGMVEKRILGPISVGVWGLSDKTVGGAISIEF